MYVPLNLATSFFGMNLQQLNGSGHDVWVFAVTAVVTLAITGGSWFLTVQINSYLKWRKRSYNEPYNGETQFTLAVRLALLAYLILNGHTSWMFISGAWWRILTNHKSRLVGDNCPREDMGRWNAGEYVSKYGSKAIRGGFYEHGHYYRPFHQAGIQWRSARNL